jgi:hypothetical protein
MREIWQVISEFFTALIYAILVGATVLTIGIFFVYFITEILPLL